MPGKHSGPKPGRGKAKKIVSIVLVCVILLGAAGGGGYYYLKNRSGSTVNVYPISSGIGYADSYASRAETEGPVTADKMQSVFLTSTQTVTEIYVQEGQQINVGDPILAFDTTLDEVELEKKQIEIDQYKLDLSDAQAKLKEIGTYHVGYGGGYAPPMPTRAPLVSLGVPYFQGGSGTREDPYVFMWSEQLPIFDAMVDYLIAVARGEPAEMPPIPDMPDIPATAEPEESPTPSPEPSPTPSAEPSPTPDGTPTATPEPSGEPVEPSATPEPGTEPIEPSATPEPGTEPVEPSATPEPGTEPVEPSATPEPGTGPTDTPEATETPAEPAATAEATAVPAPEATDVPITEATAVPVAEATDAPGGAYVVPSIFRARHTGTRILRAEGEAPSDPGAGDMPADPDVSSQPGETPVPTITPVPGDGNIYIVFEIREANALNGMVYDAFEFAFRQLWGGEDAAGEPVTGWIYRIMPAAYSPYVEDTGESDWGGGYFYSGPTYTLEEINQMKIETQQQIADSTLALRMAEQELKALEFELSNGEVLCTTAGVVKTVLDPQEALEQNQPVVLISGGGGYYITGVMSEFDLGILHVGDTVTVQDWMTGTTLDGEIVEISEYPVDESNSYFYYWSPQSNENASKYPFTVRVDEDAGLREGYYANISYSLSGSETPEEGVFVMDNAFLRTEGARTYVYAAGENDRLEKRYVSTGRSYYGSSTEITGGLDMETDYVAFPYGRAVKEGAKVEYKEDLQSLYGSYY